MAKPIVIFLHLDGSQALNNAMVVKANELTSTRQWNTAENAAQAPREGWAKVEMMNEMLRAMRAEQRLISSTPVMEDRSELQNKAGGGGGYCKLTNIEEKCTPALSVCLSVCLSV